MEGWTQLEERSLSVIIAVYNGEAFLRELCRRLGEVLPRVATQHEIAARALTGLFALEYLLLYDVMELMFRGQHVRNPPTRSCTNLFVK